VLAYLCATKFTAWRDNTNRTGSIDFSKINATFVQMDRRRADDVGDDSR
jgi:hypothetical protein